MKASIIFLLIILSSISAGRRFPKIRRRLGRKNSRFIPPSQTIRPPPVDLRPELRQLQPTPAEKQPTFEQEQKHMIHQRDVHDDDMTGDELMKLIYGEQVRLVQKSLHKRGGPSQPTIDLRNRQESKGLWKEDSQLNGEEILKAITLISSLNESNHSPTGNTNNERTKIEHVDEERTVITFDDQEIKRPLESHVEMFSQLNDTSFNISGNIPQGLWKKDEYEYNNDSKKIPASQVPSEQNASNADIDNSTRDKIQFIINETVTHSKMMEMKNVSAEPKDTNYNVSINNTLDSQEIPGEEVKLFPKNESFQLDSVTLNISNLEPKVTKQINDELSKKNNGQESQKPHGINKRDVAFLIYDAYRMQGQNKSKRTSVGIVTHTLEPKPGQEGNLGNTPHFFRPNRKSQPQLESQYSSENTQMNDETTEKNTDSETDKPHINKPRDVSAPLNYDSGPEPLQETFEELAHSELMNGQDMHKLNINYGTYPLSFSDETLKQMNDEAIHSEFGNPAHKHHAIQQRTADNDQSNVSRPEKALDTHSDANAYPSYDPGNYGAVDTQPPLNASKMFQPAPTSPIDPIRNRVFKESMSVAPLLSSLALWNSAHSTQHYLRDQNGNFIVSPIKEELINCTLSINNFNRTVTGQMPCPVAVSVMRLISVSARIEEVREDIECTIIGVSAAHNEYMTTVPCAVLMQVTREHEKTLLKLRN